MGRALWVTIAVLGLCLSSRTVYADAVPPPPKHCPKGQVGITSHSGPQCVLEAPKNCPPGYHGVLRGRCELARCTQDDQCEKGRRCLQIEVCQEYRELHWTGWGWSAQKPVLRDNFLGGPPRPQPPGPNKKDWVLLSICGQDGACPAPAECRPAGLCYPPSAIGKTKAKVAPSASAEPPPVAEAGAPDAAETVEAVPGGNPTPGATPTATPVAPNPPPAPNPEPPSDSGGGCRKGCSATSTPSAVGWVGLPLLLGVGLLRRRRRRARKRKLSALVPRRTNKRNGD